MEILLFIIGAVTGIIGAFGAQTLKHFLDLRQNRIEWSRQEEDRGIERQQRHDQETRRLKYELRKERLGPIYGYLNEINKWVSAIDIVDNDLRREVKLLTSPETVGGLKAVQEVAQNQSNKLLYEVALITETKYRKKVQMLALMVSLSEDIRSKFLAEKALLSEAYDALEDYVASV